MTLNRVDGQQELTGDADEMAERFYLLLVSTINNDDENMWRWFAESIAGRAQSASCHLEFDIDFKRLIDRASHFLIWSRQHGHLCGLVALKWHWQCWNSRRRHIYSSLKGNPTTILDKIYTELLNVYSVVVGLPFKQLYPIFFSWYDHFERAQVLFAVMQPKRNACRVGTQLRDTGYFS